MKASSIYAKIVKTAALSTLVAGALVGVTTAQARSHVIQEVQYVQVAPQVVVRQAPPVYIAPVVRHRRPVVLAPVVASLAVPYAFVPGRIYYIDGRPYLNGRPYVRRQAYGHYKHPRPHHGRIDRHGGRHDEGRHLGQYR